MGNLGWGVALAQPNAERTALINLARQGYDCYAPRFQQLVVKNQTKIRREQYLFGRYFFVLIADTWRSITSTKGVSELLLINSEKPALLPVGEIDRLRAREVEGFVRLPRASHNPALRDGASVRVMEGKFSGLNGICSGMATQDRVVVLLSMMGRKVRAQIAATDLEPALARAS